MSDRQISLDLGNLNESLIKVWMTLDHVNNLSEVYFVSFFLYKWNGKTVAGHILNLFCSYHLIERKW